MWCSSILGGMFGVLLMMMMMIFWRRLDNIYPEIPTKYDRCHPRQGWTPPTSQRCAFGRRISVEWCRMPDKSRCLFDMIQHGLMLFSCSVGDWFWKSFKHSNNTHQKGRLNLNPQSSTDCGSGKRNHEARKPSLEVFFCPSSEGRCQPGNI